MRLANHILLWASLAVLTPLTLLSLSATLYSEWRFERDVQREARSALANIVGAVDRRLVFDREIITALAQTPPVQDFIPVLEQSLQGEIHEEYFERYSRLTDFLTGLQNAVPSIRAIYLLDRSATPMVGVQLGAGRSPQIRLPEISEAMQRQLSAELAGLRAGELAHLNIPSLHHLHTDNGLLDSVVPLSIGPRHVGYLIAVPSSADMDRLLDNLSRPAHTRLMISENSDEDTNSDGRVLYSDSLQIHFEHPPQQAIAESETPHKPRVPEFADGFWQAALQDPVNAVYKDGDGSDWYYLAFPTFPNRLGSWVFSLHRVSDADSSPFARIRWTILAVTLFTALVILLLARFGARKIARPLQQLSHQLRQFSSHDQAALAPALSQSNQGPGRGPDELRELQAAAQTLADELRSAEQQRDRAQKALLLQAKLASIGQLAAGISHELNNPLNNILSLARLTQRELTSDPEAAQEDLESLREEAIRASGIISSVLDYTRQAPPSLQYFEASHWLQRCCKLLLPQTEESGVTLNWDAPSDPDLSRLYGDPNQLQQVLVNLVVNALHASTKGDAIQVTIGHGKDQDHTWRCCVTDQGPGLSAEQLSAATEPFFTTRAAGVGHGLGLSISLGIVQAHGGTLTLHNRAEHDAISTHGLQACFTIPLPPTDSPANPGQ